MMSYINTIQDNKGILQGGLGDGIVCVTALGTSCKGSQPYLTTKNFSLNLAKILAGSGIGVRKDFLGSEIQYPASYIVMLHGFYFDYGKIYKDLKDTFKRDPHAFKSSLFPDGWWNFFTQAYGTGGNEGISNFKNATNIIRQLSASDIVGGKITTLNQYDKGGSLWSFLGDCFTDYHCVLDIASIATLAIPGVGLAVSAGLDFINAASYGVEGLTAKDKSNRDAAYLAGSLTLLGGLLGGGIGQTRKIIKAGQANPKIYQYADEVMSKVKLEIPNAKNLKNLDLQNKGNLLQRSFSKNKMDETLAKIYKETQEKYGLKQSEMKVAHDILSDLSKIDPSVAQKYTEALNTIEGKMKGSIEKGNLLRLGNDSKFQKTLIENNGDIVTALDKHLKKVAKREAVMEATLFVALTNAMENPSVQKWIGQKYNYIKYMNRTDIRGMVEKEGYDWGNVKEIFYSDGTAPDNVKLKQAWEKEWRPELGRDWLFKNPKYQTKTFKSLLSTPERSAALRSDDLDFVKKDNERYFDDIDHVKLYNKNANVRGDNLNYDEAASEMERAINGN